MEEGNQHLHQPLLSTTTTTYSAEGVNHADDGRIKNMKLVLSNSAISLRFVFIIFIGVVSAWANYEASKSFDIAIANEAIGTPIGKRFDLFYVSNDRISRLVITTSKFVEDILYPNNDGQPYPNKKQVNLVTVRLSNRNLTDRVTVESPEVNEFVLSISPSVMEDDNFREAMFSAVQQGMARVWVWDGKGKAPLGLVNGMVKYISSLNAVSGKILSAYSSGDAFCFENMDANAMAEFLSYCEEQKNGFIRELNQAIKDGWEDGILEDALVGVAAQHLCVNFRSTG